MCDLSDTNFLLELIQDENIKMLKALMASESKEKPEKTKIIRLERALTKSSRV